MLAVESAVAESAILVYVAIAKSIDPDELQEFQALALSSGVVVKGLITAVRSAPEPKFFMGKGKADDVADFAKIKQADVILFHPTLSPGQERNLEKLCQCRVIDRTALILDIFSQRARSYEGKLQVELAQLKHLSTRLIRGWTHLERQKGGIGLRGPGETQLETDRRLLQQRIRHLNARLEKLDKQREQGRKQRKKTDVLVISLVGYTNAGKSTLFNQLTDSHVYVKDQLFATLDPTLRHFVLPVIGRVVCVDTVGFIRHLPHDLIAAFRSTLQETIEADLLLHVIDVSDEQQTDYIQEVNAVLAQIGADKVPQIKVYNKIDQLNEFPRIERNSQGKLKGVWLSAQQNQGMDLLIQALTEHFQSLIVQRWFKLPPEAGKIRAQLFEYGQVLSETITEQGGWNMEVKIKANILSQLEQPSDFI